MEVPSWKDNDPPKIIYITTQTLHTHTHTHTSCCTRVGNTSTLTWESNIREDLARVRWQNPHSHRSTPVMPESSTTDFGSFPSPKWKLIQVTKVKDYSLCFNSEKHSRWAQRKVFQVPNQIALSVFLSVFVSTLSWGILGCLLQCALGDSINKLSRSTEKFQLLKISGELHSNTPAFLIHRIGIYLYQNCLLTIFLKIWT